MNKLLNYDKIVVDKANKEIEIKMILTYILSIEDDEKREIVENIYNLYYKKMYSVAFGILNNMHDSEDAVQDAFFNITFTYDLFRKPREKATATLVYIYTRNAAINIYNKNKRHSRVVELVDSVDKSIYDIADDEDVSKIAIDNETSRLVSDAIDQLDEMYRDVIIMKYYYNMKNIEIAKVLDKDTNTVAGRLFRARAKLKEKLGDEVYERITR